MIEAITCPACGSRHRLTLYKVENRLDEAVDGYRTYIFRDVLHTDRVVTRMCLCLGCSLLYLTPRFSEADLARLYSPDYFKKRAGYEPGWRPADHHSAEAIRSSEAQRRTLIAQMVQPYAQKVRSILDMGGGKGSLIPDLPGLAQAMVCDPGVQDTEPHIIRIETPEAVAPVDLVMSTHVLEHLNDPRAFLSRLRRLVSPDGLIYVEVPYEGPPAIFRKQGIGEHLNFFTMTALRNMAADCGLQTLRMESRRYMYALWQTNAICAVFRPGPPTRQLTATAFAAELAGRFAARLHRTTRRQSPA